MGRQSKLEAAAAHICKVLGLEVEAEYRFHPKRRWRFDFAIPKRKIAIEIEGGTWIQGRHARGPGMAKDCEKYNAAANLGWIVYRFTTDMVTNGALTDVVLRLRGRGDE